MKNIDNNRIQNETDKDENNSTVKREKLGKEYGKTHHKGVG